MGLLRFCQDLHAAVLLTAYEFMCSSELTVKNNHIEKFPSSDFKVAPYN